jgi:hypothetical protein
LLLSTMFTNSASGSRSIAQTAASATRRSNMLTLHHRGLPRFVGFGRRIL